MWIKNEDERDWYMREAAEENWSVRTLNRDIGSQYYSILKDSKQIYAAKYLTYLPTKEELYVKIERQKEVFALQTCKYQD